MAHVEFSQNTLSTSASFTLTLKNLGDQTSGGLFGYALPDSLSVGLDSGNSQAGMVYAQTINYVWMSGAWEQMVEADNAQIDACADAFAAAHDGRFDQDNLSVPVFKFYAQAGGGISPTDDAEYWGTGWLWSTAPEAPADIWVGPTTVSYSGTVGVKNVVAAVEVTDASYEFRQSPRWFGDRSAAAGWYADGQSKYYATLGALSAEENAAWSDELIPVGGDVARLDLHIGYANAAQTNKTYAEISGISFSEDGVAASISDISYWSTNGSDWTYSASDPGSQKWHAFGLGATLALQRVGGGITDSAGFTIAITVKGPIRWNIEAGRFGETGFSHDNTPRFDVGLNQHYPDAPDETIWLSTGLSEYYTELIWRLPGGSMPDVEKVELPLSADCEVDEQWLEDNNLRLYKTAAYSRLDGTRAEQTIDVVDVPIHLPSTGARLNTTNPYWGPAITLSHSEISVDIPPGETERPSAYVGFDGATVANEDEFTVADGATEPYVSRELKTRYWLRMDRLAARVPDTYNTHPDWPIKMQANEHAEHDDEAWKTEVPVEDVTNWDNSSFLEVSFSSVPAAVGDGTHDLVLGIDYSTVVITDPWYTCYDYRFGENGSWDYTRTQWQDTFTATISGGSAVFDLGIPTSENYCPVLQHVDEFAIYFPESGEWVLADIKPVRDPNSSSRNLAAQPAIDAWDFESDYCGFGATMDGKPILRLEYGTDRYGVQKCLLQHQERYHCPTTTSSTDLCFAWPLSRLKDEFDWQEQLTGTYHTSTVETNIGDGTNVLGEMYWWDLERGTGDVSLGTSGGINAAMAVRSFQFNRLPSCALTMNCRFHLDGQGHGLVVENGERIRGTGGRSETGTESDVIVWEKETIAADPTWTQIGTSDANGHGRFVTVPAPEDEKILEDGGQYHDTEAKAWSHAFSFTETGQKYSFGSFVVREFAFNSGEKLSEDIASVGAAWDPPTHVIMITDTGLTDPNSAGHRMLRTKGQTRWSERYAVPASEDVDWGNIICTRGREEFVEGVPSLRTRLAWSTDGDWNDPQTIEAGYTCPFGIRSVLGNTFYITAYKDGKQYLLRREEHTTHDALEAPLLIGASSEVPAALCQHPHYYGLVAGVQNNNATVLYYSSDEGDTWAAAQSEGSLTYPYLWAGGTYTWLVGYYDSSAYVVQYRNNSTEFPEVSARAEVGQADEGRAAIIYRPYTHDLFVIAPKTTDWGLGQPTPGLAEYISTDDGDTWTLNDVHEVVT